MLHRRRLPAQPEPVSRAFRETLARVEGATAALAAAVPTPRLPGRPLAEALLEFEEGLREAWAAMDGWRHPGLEAEWTACRAGLAEALARAGALRAQAPDPGGFEGLVAMVAELLDPLDAFASAARALRSRRS